MFQNNSFQLPQPGVSQPGFGGGMTPQPGVSNPGMGGVMTPQPGVSSPGMMPQQQPFGRGMEGQQNPQQNLLAMLQRMQGGGQPGASGFNTGGMMPQLQPGVSGFSSGGGVVTPGVSGFNVGGMQQQPGVSNLMKMLFGGR